MKTTVDDFKHDGKWVRTYRTEEGQFFTRSYITWRSMIDRCKPGGKWQSKYPTYIGCEASQLFLSPDSFIEWSTTQPGGGLPGYQLDKDLLNPGNKLYSEDSCVYLPQGLNKFLTDKESIRGQFPRGVHYNKVVNKLCAKVSIDGKNTHLGYFNCPDKAFNAYKNAKEAHARIWAERLKSDYESDPRAIEALLKYTVIDTLTGGL